MSKQEVQKGAPQSTGYSIWMMFFLVILALGAGALFVARKERAFPIEEVVVRGEVNPTDQAQIQKILKPAVENGFFNVKLQKMQASVQSLSDISQAEVRRIWPATLLINVSAQKPVARFGNNSLINAYGEIFQVNLSQEEVKKLPKFIGDVTSTVQMLSYYQQISDILKPLNMQIIAVESDPGQFLSVTLDSGVTLKLGRDNVLDRVERFAKVYPEVFATNARRAQEVDLQYQNGMAVKWAS